MATLSAIRLGLKNTINNGVAKDIFCYDTVSDLAQLPAAVILPTDAMFQESMANGLDCWDFHIFVLCSRAETQTGQEELDGFISGSGSSSIRKALTDRPDLGLSDGTDASILGMEGYGGHFRDSSVSLVGAILKVRVYTDGRS